MKQKHRPYRQNEEDKNLEIRLDQESKSSAGFKCGYCRVNFEEHYTPQIELDDGVQRLYHKACWKEWKGKPVHEGKDLIVAIWEKEDELEKVQEVLDRAYMKENNANPFRIAYHTLCAMLPGANYLNYAMGDNDSLATELVPELEKSTPGEKIGGSLLEIAQAFSFWLIVFPIPVIVPVTVAAILYTSLSVGKAGFNYGIDKSRRNSLKILDAKKSHLEQQIQQMELEWEKSKTRDIKEK